jgi:regulator of protease activity HflC (stomatin/prohibitin superfamily)
MAIAVLAVLFMGTGCMKTIDDGTVGVKRVWGKVQPDELQPGFHFVYPGMDIIVVDTKIQALTAESSSASKDLQKVATKITTNVSVTPGSASDLIRSVGDNDDLKAKIMLPAIQESVKAVTARYTAEELVTKRAEVKVGIEEALQKFLDELLQRKKLENAVVINSMAIEEFTFSEDFDLAIEAKVKAEQEALRAQNEKTRRITEAEAAAREAELKADADAYARVKEAEAKAQSTKAQADAQAYATQVEAVERAKAIEVEGDALRDNPTVIELRKVEQWDGKLPVYNMGMGGDVSPLISLPAAPAQN